jgi:putative solute:sodium symporter small subunit
MQSKMDEYWAKNVRLIAILLGIWAVVAYVFGILLVVPLNMIKIAGFPLGFWFAQQGSIYVFVVLIFVYCWKMNTLDKEYDVQE